MADSTGQQPNSGTPPASPPAVASSVPACGVSSAGGAESVTPLPMMNADFKTDTPKKPKRCNCRHSQCLKLYCECFAAGLYCNGCNCSNCSNNVENEDKRKSAIDATLLRNPDAFKPKIKSGPVALNSRPDVDGKLPLVAKHHKGCHCKKSGCLKKYCECFEMQVLCSKICKCVGCKNFEGSEDRQGLLHGENGCQKSSGVLNGSIEIASPPKRRKRPDDSPGPVVGNFGRMNTQQARFLSSSGLASSYAGLSSEANYPLIRSSKMRCPLADIVRPEHVRDLCTLLVTECREAEMEFHARPDNRAEELRVKEENGSCSLDSSIMDKRAEVRNSQETPANCLPLEASVDEADAERKQPKRLDATTVSRPASPTTLALMCDEEDAMFAEPSRSGAFPASLPEQGNGISMELYAEQERRVLVIFRDTLSRLSTAARIRESQSSLAVTRPEASLKDEPNNTTVADSTDVRPQHDDVKSCSLPTSSSGLPAALDKGTPHKDQT